MHVGQFNFSIWNSALTKTDSHLKLIWPLMMLTHRPSVCFVLAIAHQIIIFTQLNNIRSGAVSEPFVLFSILTREKKSSKIHFWLQLFDCDYDNHFVKTDDQVIKERGKRKTYRAWDKANEQCLKPQHEQYDWKILYIDDEIGWSYIHFGISQHVKIVFL